MTTRNKILIVDDDERAQKTLQGLLGTTSAELYFAGDGRSALYRAQEVQPDLILLDVMMPGTDGIQVCRELRALPEMAEVPIIMVTALDDADSRLDSLQAGANDFISKPLRLSELMVLLLTYLKPVSESAHEKPDQNPDRR